MSLLRLVLDFDRDGELSFYGERDCDGFDGTRHPNKLEIPRNGVDEDCSGRDLSVGDDAIRFGVASHGKPADLSAAPHIIMVTTDALSYRHTSLGGYQRNVTPHLDAFAERATVFVNAFSVAPETATAFPSLFSGRYPSEFGRAVPTMAEMLQRAGYRTHAIVGSRVFSRAAWPALLRGFEVVDDTVIDRAEKRYKTPKPHTSPEITEAAIAVLEADDPRPLLLWLHYFDHHPFYSVPRGEPAFDSGRTPVDRYDSELRYADSYWGKLFAAVESRYAPGDYVLLFTSDHGEAFDANHSDEHHAHCLRTEETHVPFIVQAPVRRGERVAGLVSHLDVLPTVVDLTEAADTAELRGESLVRALWEGAPLDKTIVLTTFFAPNNRAFGGEIFRQIGVRTDELFFLLDRERRTTGLYRWRSDPLDRDDVSDQHPDVAELGRYLARRHVQRYEPTTP